MTRLYLRQKEGQIKGSKFLYSYSHAHPFSGVENEIYVAWALVVQYRSPKFSFLVPAHERGISLSKSPYMTYTQERLTASSILQQLPAVVNQACF